MCSAMRRSRTETLEIKIDFYKTNSTFQNRVDGSPYDVLPTFRCVQCNKSVVQDELNGENIFPAAKEVVSPD